jgi:hypothetical protein
MKAKKIHELEIPWKGYTITFFLKPDASTEVAEAVYDVMNDIWILTPVILPDGFNVETWYAKDMEGAEKICEQLDLQLGKLKRLNIDLTKFTAEPVDELANPQDREEAIDKTKTEMKALMYTLASTFIQYHTARNVAHEKLMADPDRKPMDRFTSAEIVWKYLERMGYLETLHKLAQAHDAGDFERI